jgi:hypothetical protein
LCLLKLEREGISVALGTITDTRLRPHPFERLPGAGNEELTVINACEMEGWEAVRLDAGQRRDVTDAR